MAKKPTRNRAVLHLIIELFFAVLPLFVLGSVWPSHEQGHPASFWHGPEWSMTACVLYGLALARMQQGMMMNVRRADIDLHGTAARFVVISMLPISGIIVSILLITKLSTETHSLIPVIVQFVNLACSILIFFMLGGYGVDRSEH